MFHIRSRFSAQHRSEVSCSPSLRLEAAPEWDALLWEADAVAGTIDDFLEEEFDAMVDAVDLTELPMECQSLLVCEIQSILQRA